MTRDAHSGLRRQLLKGALAVGVGAPLSGSLLTACATPPGRSGPGGVAPVKLALERLLPDHARQFELHLLPRGGVGDRFEITGETGHIVLRASSPATLLTALHHYLKYTANAHVSWAGSQLDLPPTLPGPTVPVSVQTQLAYRYALNDTDDGYSGPYRDWRDWERMIDVLALHGYNAALVTVGQEAVYHRLLQQFGYSDAEARAWIPAPAHQPWWLMQNMSGFGGPVSPRLLEKRVELGQRIVARMRELGITPVMPGYAGTVPVGFAQRNPGAKVVEQGDWCGFPRPDWLDPTGAMFGPVAEAFYARQRDLFGDSTLYKMDLLHEGGRSGDVDVGAAARGVQDAMLAARPDATWVILGWQKNPRADLLAGLRRDRVLIVDGLSDRYEPAPDRDRDWAGTPYAFGSIPNFGGHTTLGAKTDAWEQRFFTARARKGSALHGIAYMPEGAYRDAAAFSYFSELAWRDGPADLDDWFARYATFRYGSEDVHAQAAWRALGASVFRLKTDQFSEPPDSLFAARPSLDTGTAAMWSPAAQLYDASLPERALLELLQIAPWLRGSDAWRYDVVDLARQCLANRARARLPRIRAAFEARDLPVFRQLAAQWLDEMRLSERLLATHRGFMLGAWLAQARAWGKDEAERAQLEYDARSILTVWGPRKAADDNGLRDYANREWAGLVSGLYLPRWQRFFTSLEAALRTGEKPETIDWFAMEDAWAHANDAHPTQPAGSSEAVAQEVAALLQAG